jgi:hypothetical protein
MAFRDVLFTHYINIHVFGSEIRFLGSGITEENRHSIPTLFITLGLLGLPAVRERSWSATVSEASF